jgi:hypothetical protein
VVTTKNIISGFGYTLCCVVLCCVVLCCVDTYYIEYFIWLALITQSSSIRLSLVNGG